ncbi:MAG TPA: GNAT family N-acetyltransferase [Edaphocola sp.]|nr:GNAT family N-acetyltransferase [Edaphocola sp.]
MRDLLLKRLGIADLLPLQKLARLTFRETFTAQNTEENMRQYLSERLSAKALLAELSHPLSRFYMVLCEEQPLGYLKLNFGSAQSEPEDTAAMEIERFYIYRQYHGWGVGQFLLDSALEVAKQEQVSYVWLGVWEENARAIQFYRKNGFSVFDKHRFILGNDVQTDLMMRAELK